MTEESYFYPSSRLFFCSSSSYSSFFFYLNAGALILNDIRASSENQSFACIYVYQIVLYILLYFSGKLVSAGAIKTDSAYEDSLFAYVTVTIYYLVNKAVYHVVCIRHLIFPSLIW